MAKMYQKYAKEKARKLRRQGWSLGEIGLEMKIPKNTLSGWVKDIRLIEKQKERIRQKIVDSGIIGRSLALKTNRDKIEIWKEDIRKKTLHYGGLARKSLEIGKLICGLLYLCEGAKYPSSRFLCFGNTDPKIIVFFLNSLRKYYLIEEKKLRFDINYRSDQNYKALKEFWSKTTGIAKSKFFRRKPDTRTKGKPTLREGYRGVGRLIYYDTNLQFELQSIGESIIGK